MDRRLFFTALGAVFGALLIWWRTGKWEWKQQVSFDRIVMPKFTKDVDEMRTWRMDIRDVLSRNAIKDMLVKEDEKFLAAVDKAMEPQALLAAKHTGAFSVPVPLPTAKYIKGPRYKIEFDRLLNTGVQPNRNGDIFLTSRQAGKTDSVFMYNLARMQKSAAELAAKQGLQIKFANDVRHLIS